jgi:cobalamin biosynthesis Co2+ chelatase CbiK
MEDPGKELEKLRNNTEFTQLTVAQIVKDFQSVGIDVQSQISASFSYDALENVVCGLIQQLHAANPEKFRRLLYTVDLPETDVKRISRSPHFYVDLSQMIIKREFLKILIRTSYQIKNDNGNS